MATNEHGRPQSRGTKLQVPEIPRLAAETISSGAPGECFFLDSPFNRTNIRLLWSRVVADATSHAARRIGRASVQRWPRTGGEWFEATSPAVFTRPAPPVAGRGRNSGVNSRCYYTRAQTASEL